MRCICLSQVQRSSPSWVPIRLLDCAIKHPLAQKQAAALDLASASSQHLPRLCSVPSSYVRQQRPAGA